MAMNIAFRLLAGVTLLTSAIIFAPRAVDARADGASFDIAQAADKATPNTAKKKPTKPRPPGAADAECAFTGKRITHLLARDDADAANRFFRFYATFKCPEGHLGMAFRCVVTTPVSTQGKELTERVEKCWMAPDTKFLNQ